MKYEVSRSCQMFEDDENNLYVLSCQSGTWGSVFRGRTIIEHNTTVVLQHNKLFISLNYTAFLMTVLYDS